MTAPVTPLDQARMAATLAKMKQLPTLIQNQQTPVFTSEGPANYAAATARNKPFAKPGPELTPLNDAQEGAFRQWVSKYKIPFDPTEATPDYDMRGYWLAHQDATHTQGQHFPDTYKTVRDTTFSNESKYAKPNTPYIWVGNSLVDKRTNQVVFK